MGLFAEQAPFCFGFSSFSFAKEVPFTQEDRERLIRLEVKVEKLEARIEGLQKQIDRIQKQIDEQRSDFRTYMSITFGALFTIFFLQAKGFSSQRYYI